MDTLELIEEAKVKHLLDCHGDCRFEASGLVARNDHFVVIFDNLSQAAIVAADLSAGNANELIGDDDETTGFEDVTYDPLRHRYYVIIEAKSTHAGELEACLVEYDDDFHRLDVQKLPFKLPSKNKGFEGLALVRRDEEDYLFALCEGNFCLDGDEGKQPGGGRIQIFHRGDERWTHVGTLNVPATANFVDYASIDIRDGRVAIMSQQDARLWLGTLRPNGWGFVDEGVVYALPEDEDGKKIYCNAEGIALLPPDRVAIASDRKKKGGPDRCGAKDESIHIFRFSHPFGS